MPKKISLKPVVLACLLTLCLTSQADEGRLVHEEVFEEGNNSTFVPNLGTPSIERITTGATEYVMKLGSADRKGELVTVDVPEINLEDFRFEVEFSRAHIAIFGENWRVSCNASGESDSWRFGVDALHDESGDQPRTTRINAKAPSVTYQGMHTLVFEKVGRRIQFEVDGESVEVPGMIPAEHLSSMVRTLRFAGAGDDWQIRSFRLWDLSEVDMGSPVDLRFRYYPGENKLLIFPSRVTVDSFVAALRNPDAEEIFRDQVDVTDTVRSEGLLLDVPALPEGVSSLVVLIGEDGAEEELRTYEIQREIFPWEGNTLGMGDTIHPPFKPVAVDDSAVEVVMRRMAHDGTGLWSSVSARTNDSDDFRELLAGPVHFLVNGSEVLEGAGKMESSSSMQSVFVGAADHSSVRIAARAITEIDGCLRYELDLLPGDGTPLNSLSLEIPLLDGEAPLWHVTTTGLRNNPAGALPEGDGLLWSSLNHGISQNRPTPGWLNDFLPYIWLGAEERGIAWFADNDRGWVLDPDVAALEIHREGEKLLLRVNLVQRPVVITEPVSIVFGMMASPVKPMPEDWRRLVHNATVDEHPSLQWMGAQYWGSDTNFANKYPRNGDLSILDAMRDARSGKTVDTEAFAAGWAERNLQPDMPVIKPADRMLRLIETSIRMAGAVRRQQDSFSVYWEEFIATNRLHPETETFGQEWTGQYAYNSYTGGIVASYRDFAAYWGAEFLRRGIGLYFDNAFPEAAYDPVTTSAYRFTTGSIQPSAGVWARREHLRRIWNLHRELPPEELPAAMVVHMTNTNIIAYLGWSDAILDLEHWPSVEPLQSRFTPEQLRVQTTGLHTGNIPLALSSVRDSEQPEDVVAAAELPRAAALMVHEVKPNPHTGKNPLLRPMLEFGYGAENCRVMNYWSDKPGVTTSDPSVKTLLLERDGQLLLLICGWNAEETEVAFQFDPTILEAQPASTELVLGDAAGLNYDADEGALSMMLPAYGSALIHLK